MGRSLSTKRIAGVSFIELIVVLVIISILGIIGIPSYRGYMQRAQRTEAKDALVRLATNQERFYLGANTYTSNMVNLGFDTSGITEDGFYQLSVVSTQLTFTATAQPVAGGGMAADVECASFTIDETGARSASPDPNGRCW